jgi:putative PEP-CTERM system TPR-repeat lipoprotein
MFGASARFVILTVFTALLVVGCEKDSTEALIQRAERAIADHQVRAAMLDLRTVLREDPDNPKARWLLSGLYLSIEDGASAEKELRKALELGVGDDAVLPMLARSLQLQGKTGEVLEISPASQLTPPAAAEIEASRALAYRFQGELSKAEAAINLALRRAPDSAFVRYVHAETLVAGEQVEKAIEELTALTNLQPDFSPAWSLLGRLRAQRREYAAAEVAYSNAIDHRFLAINDRIDRGFARLEQEKIVEAQEDVNVLLELSPGTHRVQLLAGLIHLQKQDLDLAKDALDAAYSKSPDDLHVVIALATADTALGNFSQGRNLAEKAFALSSQSIAARKLLARYALRDRDGIAAESLIRSVAQRFPSDLVAKQMLARSLILQGKTAEAAPLAQEVADGLGESLGAQVWAGIALMAAQEKEQGIKILSRAVELTPEGRMANSLLVIGLMESKSEGEALAAAKKFAETNPGDAEAQNLLALTYLAQGDSVKARATLQRALSMDPGNRAATRTLASLYLRSGDAGSAGAILDDALDAHPDDVHLLILRANVARIVQDAKAMERYLRQAIERNPQTLWPRILLAKALLDDGNSQAAFSTFSGVPVDGNPVALALKAEAASRLGQYGEARAALENLASIAPNDPSVQIELVKVYSALGDDYRSEQAIVRLAELAPEDARAKLAMAKVLARQGKVAEADVLIDNCGLVPEDPRVLSARQAVAVVAGRHDEAVYYARQLFEENNEAANVVELSRVLAAAGNQKESAKVLNDWLDNHPNDIPVRVELANIYQRRGEDDRYIDQLLQIIEVEPRNSFALNNLAWSLRVQSPLEALGYARTAYQEDPTSAAIMDTLAMVYAQNKDYENALRFIEKAIDADAAASVFRLHRAEIKSASGDKEGAVAELRELLREVLPEEIKSKAESLLIKIDAQSSAQFRPARCSRCSPDGYLLA